MDISSIVFESWTQGDFIRVEKLLTEEIRHPPTAFHCARSLAHRALVRCRLKQYNKAITDAGMSIEVQRSVMGHIALAVAHIGSHAYDSAIRTFDLVFTEGLSTGSNILLLMKAILLFECGKHHDAISRTDDLIRIVHYKALYTAVRAQMHRLLGDIALRKGDHKRAVELFKRAQEAIPLQESPHVIVISLIFSWDFKDFDLVVQKQLQKCVKPFEDMGDAVVQSNPTEAVVQYSTALSLNPSNSANLLVKRSRARAMLALWGGALKDADEAIQADPQSPWGYERRHAALHALQRYNEAVDAANHMHSIIDDSLDQDTRELCEKYIPPARSETVISNIVRDVLKICPLVLIDVKSGRLCDGPQRMDIFKSELPFKELVSSMTLELDDGQILRTVVKYFQYVTFSHVWEGKEPSYQDVQLAGSVWDLDASPLNDKLRKFCEVVREDGYRWAWSDTCCIDKTISTVLNQSLKMMYKWYEASAATLVYLANVDSLLDIGSLKDSIWMTRAWTSQELLASKVIRFHDRNWKPYLGDTRKNHKESPKIMQELADSIGVTPETIKDFNPESLTVQEKLRLASTRNASVEEDIAYSLIGIFGSDIRPDYGERDAALGHLLEEIVARSGDVTVLAWAGKSSRYNSCLPTTLAVYSRTPPTSPAIEDTEIDARVAALRSSLSPADAMLLHNQITRFPPARFGNRRLHLPCIIFAVKRLGVQDIGSGEESLYKARVPGIGHVEFQTSNRLSLIEPRKLILVHPWIQKLRDLLGGFIWGSTSDDEPEFDSETETEYDSAPPSPLHVMPAVPMDDYTRALRFVARLQQPFHALLLQQQPNGEFKRVAAEHEIVVPGLDRRINFAKDVRAEIVEIL